MSNERRNNSNEFQAEHDFRAQRLGNGFPSHCVTVGLTYDYDEQKLLNSTLT